MKKLTISMGIIPITILILYMTVRLSADLVDVLVIIALIYLVKFVEDINLFSYSKEKGD